MTFYWQCVIFVQWNSVRLSSSMESRNFSCWSQKRFQSCLLKYVFDHKQCKWIHNWLQWRCWSSTTRGYRYTMFSKVFFLRSKFSQYCVVCAHWYVTTGKAHQGGGGGKREGEEGSASTWEACCPEGGFRDSRSCRQIKMVAFVGTSLRRLLTQLQRKTDRSFLHPMQAIEPLTILKYIFDLCTLLGWVCSIPIARPKSVVTQRSITFATLPNDTVIPWLIGMLVSHSYLKRSVLR